MKKSEVSEAISQAAERGFLESEINEKIQNRINNILEEEIKIEKTKIKKFIEEKFDGDYDLASAFYRQHLVY